MQGMPKFEIAPDAKFADIIVPTMDTVRSTAILEMLLTNHRTVSFFARIICFVQYSKTKQWYIYQKGSFHKNIVKSL